MGRSSGWFGVTVLVSGLLGSVALGGTYIYVGATWGDWGASTNWSPVGVPTTGDVAVVGPWSYAAVISTQECAWLQVGYSSGGGTGYLRVYNGGNLTVGNYLHVASPGIACGCVRQYAGSTVTASTLSLKYSQGSGTAEYYLEGGTLNTTETFVGVSGKAFFTQNTNSGASTHNVPNLYVGKINYTSHGADSDVAYYHLQGGTLNVSDNVYLGHYYQARGVLNLGTATGTGRIMGTGNLVVKSDADPTRGGFGRLEGWGEVDLSGTLTNNGQVIANGWGGTEDRDLDLSENFAAVRTDFPNPGNRGWYAVNRGRLLLPKIPVAAGTGAYHWGDNQTDATVDMVNSVRLSFADVQGGEVSVALLASDRSEFETTAGNIVGIWSVDGSAFDFGSGTVSLTFRYDDARAAALGINEADLRVFRRVGDAWVDVTGAVDTAGKRITATAADSFSMFAVGTNIVYLPRAEAPAFSPEDGYLLPGQPVKITCNTPGARIYYTLDGTTPTQDSAEYTGPVAVTPGQTLSARAWADGYTQSEVTSLLYKGFDRPGRIFRLDGSVTVDGDLSEWLANEFVPLTVNYSGTSPLQSAAYAARWDGTTNQIYVAVKVNDPTHIFADMYDSWNTQDGIEVYLHTTGGEPYDYEDAQNTAQQYVLGLKTPASRTSDPRANVWATFAGMRIVPRDEIGFQAAGVEEVDEFGNPTGWLFYEVAMTAYEWLPSVGEPLPDEDPVNDPSTPIISPLSVGDRIGVDVVVCDKHAAGFGMKSECNHGSKHSDWRNIGVHKLTLHPGDVNGDNAVTAADIDALQAAVRAGSTDPAHDLNGDAAIDSGDVDYLVNTLFGTVYGDANLDGVCSFEDFAILQNHYGQSGLGWAAGDFNGDLQVSFSDFSVLQNHYGTGGVPSGAGSLTAAAAGGCGPVGVILLAAMALASYWMRAVREG